MDRTRPGSCCRRPGLPRASGDGAEWGRLSEAVDEAALRERGCASQQGRQANAQAGYSPFNVSWPDEDGHSRASENAFKARRARRPGSPRAAMRPLRAKQGWLARSRGRRQCGTPCQATAAVHRAPADHSWIDQCLHAEQTHPVRHRGSLVLPRSPARTLLPQQGQMYLYDAPG